LKINRVLANLLNRNFLKSFRQSGFYEKEKKIKAARPGFIIVHVSITRNLE